MEEIWKTIEDYPNYMVSNLGNVKALNYNKTGEEKILKTSHNNGGYHSLTLSKNNKKKQITVHKLVAEAFIPNPENKPCIDHINTDRTDNRAENLRWVTYQENQNNPKTIVNHSVAVKGNKNPMAKEILQYTLTNEFIKSWDCSMDVQRELGINNANIIQCCKGKRKTTGGYKWVYGNKKGTLFSVP